jgi:hypothetical protein
MAASDQLAKIQELRRELAELQDSLGELEIANMHAGQAISFRFIAQRIREIVDELCEMDMKLPKKPQK